MSVRADILNHLRNITVPLSFCLNLSYSRDSQSKESCIKGICIRAKDKLVWGAVPWPSVRYKKNFNSSKATRDPPPEDGWMDGWKATPVEHKNKYLRLKISLKVSLNKLHYQLITVHMCLCFSGGDWADDWPLSSEADGAAGGCGKGGGAEWPAGGTEEQQSGASSSYPSSAPQHLFYSWAGTPLQRTAGEISAESLCCQYQLCHSQKTPWKNLYIGNSMAGWKDLWGMC